MDGRVTCTYLLIESTYLHFGSVWVCGVVWCGVVGVVGVVALMLVPRQRQVYWMIK